MYKEARGTKLKSVDLVCWRFWACNSLRLALVLESSIQLPCVFLMSSTALHDIKSASLPQDLPQPKALFFTLQSKHKDKCVLYFNYDFNPGESINSWLIEITLFNTFWNKLPIVTHSHDFRVKGKLGYTVYKLSTATPWSSLQLHVVGKGVGAVLASNLFWKPPAKY